MRIEAGPAGGAAFLLSLVASGVRSRSELIRLSGLGRTTVTLHLASLFGAGLLLEGADKRRSAGGRPAGVLEINPGTAVILAADVGESRARLAATDLRGDILAEASIRVAPREAAVPTLSSLAGIFDELLRRVGPVGDRILGVGLSLPAPIDFARGRVVGPSIMPGWDGFDVPAWFDGRFGVPAVVENDVNILTLYEHRQHWSGVDHLLFIKAGTGIGSGIIADNHLFRGAQGAAGDIGHIQKDAVNGPLCRCGKVGCLEAGAAGWALVRDLQADGLHPETVRELLDLLDGNVAGVAERVRAAGVAIGETVAGVVGVLNPGVIVVGGSLSAAGETLLSGIREMIYKRSLPLATRELLIVRSTLHPDAAIRGIAQLVMERQFGRGCVDATLARLTGAVDGGPRDAAVVLRRSGKAGPGREDGRSGAHGGG